MYYCLLCSLMSGILSVFIGMYGKGAIDKLDSMQGTGMETYLEFISQEKESKRIVSQ